MSKASDKLKEITEQGMSSSFDESVRTGNVTKLKAVLTNVLATKDAKVAALKSYHNSAFIAGQNTTLLGIMITSSIANQEHQDRAILGDVLDSKANDPRNSADEGKVG
ncbi:MAG: hypothetical protein ACREQ5_02765 [Candidatus Dormibacteria bacterium]